MQSFGATYAAKHFKSAGVSQEKPLGLSAFADARTWVLLLPLLYLLLEGTSSFLVAGNAGYGGVAQEANFVQTSAVPLPIRIATAGIWMICGIAVLTMLRRVLSLAWQMKAITTLSLLTVVSCAWSDDPKLSLLKSILFVAGTFFAFYLSERFKPNDLMGLMVGLAIIIVFASVVVSIVMPEIGVDITGAWRGLFNHKNKLSRAILILLPAMLNWKAEGIGHQLRVFGLIAALFLTLETRSRTGWLITFSYLLFHVVLVYSRRIKVADKVALGFFLTGSVLFASSFVLANFAEITRALGKDPTMSGRTGIWQAAISTGMLQPAFGFGFGAFWRGIQGKSVDVFFATGFALWQGHNAYLDMWLDLGFAGLGLFLITVVSACRDAFASINSERTRELHWYVETIFIILCLGLTQGQLVIHNSLSIMLFFISCIGLRKLRLEQDQAQHAPYRFKSRPSVGENVASGYV